MAEIRRSPVEVGSLSHYLHKVLYVPGGCLGFLPSTVSTDWCLNNPQSHGILAAIPNISIANARDILWIPLIPMFLFYFFRAFVSGHNSGTQFFWGDFLNKNIFGQKTSATPGLGHFPNQDLWWKNRFFSAWTKSCPQGRLQGMRQLCRDAEQKTLRKPFFFSGYHTSRAMLSRHICGCQMLEVGFIALGEGHWWAAMSFFAETSSTR